MSGAALQARLTAFRTRGEVGLIPFVSAGDPDLDTTRDIVLALDRAGAAAIEVGIPFSDPIADGPIIQAASQRALSSGADIQGVLQMVESLQGQVEAPIVLFTYLNPVDRVGFDAFARRSREVGASAVLLTDATPGTEPALEQALAREGLARIVLVAPTTPHARLAMLAASGSGFLYIIARRGVTGVGAAQDEAPARVAALRTLTELPLYVGFGVQSAADVAAIGRYADGAIVGSELVRRLHETPREARAALAGSFLRGLREGA
jgi:tryptophan synthase alpha chain